MKNLIKEYDRLFSLYVRQKHSNGDVAKCATCGEWHGWRHIHCGHFMPRQRYATRWDERNCLPQCCKCNTYNAGEQYKMGKAIDAVFGEGTAEAMEALSRISYKLDKFSLDHKAKELKAKMLFLKMKIR